MAKRRKNPWIAAILNVILSGLGYLYIGTRRTFAVLLIITELASYVFLTTPAGSAIMSEANSLFFNAIAVLYVLAFAIDGYNEAKKT